MVPFCLSISEFESNVRRPPFTRITFPRFLFSLSSDIIITIFGAKSEINWCFFSLPIHAHTEGGLISHLYADIIESMWRKLRKTEDKKERCPLCGVEVQEDDVECSLCHYQLNLSPRHQSEGLADSIQSDLIDTLNSEDEDEDDEIIVDSSDIVSMDKPDIVVDAEISDDEYVSLPSDAAPSFVSQRMTPTGVSSTDSELESLEEEDLDLDYSLVGEKQSEIVSEHINEIPSTKDQIESHVEIEKEETDSIEKSANPVSTGLEIEIPDYKYSDSVVDKVLQKYKLDDKEELLDAARLHDDDENQYLNRKELESAAVSITTKVEEISIGETSEESIWPWNQTEPWDAKELRQQLMEAMQAAKNGQNGIANEKLDALGPHLGGEIGLIFHIGALLKKLESENKLNLLLQKAIEMYPDNNEVCKSVERLKQV